MAEPPSIVIRVFNDPELNRLTAPENTLYRPDISPKRLAFSVVLFLCIAYLVSLAGSVANLIVDGLPIVSRSVLGAALKAFPIVVGFGILIRLHWILVQFVLLYQRYASSSRRLQCCFYPSCSQYAIIAIRKYGVVVGSIKVGSRLRRCRPPGGVDFP